MSTKTVFRDQVREHLLDRMKKGQLKRGKTINLAALSRELNVSVTPIREALTQLQQARILKAVPNRGFIIAKPTYNEARDLYELVANLEVLAIENSIFFPSCIVNLRKQQIVFKTSDNILSRITAKLEFHRMLTQHYENELTQQILTDLKTRIFFYEQAFMSDESIYDKSDNQHEGIISAIEDDNVPTAALILKMNWMLISDYIQKQLSKH